LGGKTEERPSRTRSAPGLGKSHGGHRWFTLWATVGKKNWGERTNAQIQGAVRLESKRQKKKAVIWSKNRREELRKKNPLRKKETGAARTTCKLWGGKAVEKEKQQN